MTRLFGTDGIRGRVGTDLTGDLAFRVGRAAAGYFLERGVSRAILARDTRISGGMLSAAVLTGVTSVGMEAWDLDIAPTPAVSALLSSKSVDRAFGIVISASHNPYEDNGIKLFSPDGGKLSVAEEEAIERRVHSTRELDAGESGIGRILNRADLVSEYLRLLSGRFRFRMNRAKLVVDTAHGAWSAHACPLFSDVCGDITWLNTDYNGTDINAACGSTHLESLDAHLKPDTVGVAFDGDGDRCLIRICPLVSLSPGLPVSPYVTIDGDAMLFLFAKHLVTSGPVIGTVMSNGALAAALEHLGRPFVRAPVGDREVYEQMESVGSDLGGEQSGHLIFRSYQRTGDGAATALSFLKVFTEHYGESVSALCADIPNSFPQKLVNVRVAEKRPWEQDAELSGAVSRAREILGKHGRLVIRYSGTEPLLRIMAEGPAADAVEDQVAILEALFRERLSAV